MSKLRDELTNDPLKRDYSTMTDAEAAEDLTAKRIARRDRVAVPTLAQHLLENGLWTDVINATESQDAAVAEAAGLLVDACTAPPSAVDLDSVGLSGALDALVSGSIITESERAAVDALADSTVSRAQELGLGQVRTGDITRARS